MRLAGAVMKKREAFMQGVRDWWNLLPKDVVDAEC